MAPRSKGVTFRRGRDDARPGLVTQRRRIWVSWSNGKGNGNTIRRPTCASERGSKQYEPVRSVSRFCQANMSRPSCSEVEVRQVGTEIARDGDRYAISREYKQRSSSCCQDKWCIDAKLG
jgi:hypothetical protein